MRWLLLVVALALAAAAIALVAALREPPEIAPPAPPARPAPAAFEASTTPSRDAAPRLADAASADAEPDAHGTREELIDDVRGSGPARGSWTQPALALLGALHSSEMTDLACYSAGCTAQAVFGSQAEADGELELWRSSEAYVAWSSGATVTPAELRADGSVVVAIVVYPPRL
ncbi:MAG TPA: hypothetical protein VLX92_22565 [Kofleriaceae bacterium]|nr:hypothetical protein [Kofleriaceae bacterium]